MARRYHEVTPRKYGHCSHAYTRTTAPEFSYAEPLVPKTLHLDLACFLYFVYLLTLDPCLKLPPTPPILPCPLAPASTSHHFGTHKEVVHRRDPGVAFYSVLCLGRVSIRLIEECTKLLGLHIVLHDGVSAEEG